VPVGARIAQASAEGGAVVHRLSRTQGFHVHATDGAIGHIDDFLVDERLSRVCFLMVDTSNWLGGKWVGVAPESVASIDWGNQVVNVNLTRTEIRNGPTMEEANVPSHEMTPGFVII
jgi:hypothetical protein